MKVLRWIEPYQDASLMGIALADAAGSGSGVRPARGGSQVKTGSNPKIKKPTDSGPKKTPPARKAPTRGRYVDEYARPAN